MEEAPADVRRLLFEAVGAERDRRENFVTKLTSFPSFKRCPRKKTWVPRASPTRIRRRGAATSSESRRMIAAWYNQPENAVNVGRVSGPRVRQVSSRSPTAARPYSDNYNVIPHPTYPVERPRRRAPTTRSAPFVACCVVCSSLVA